MMQSNGLRDFSFFEMARFKGGSSTQIVPVQSSSNASPWDQQASQLAGGAVTNVSNGVQGSATFPGLFQLARENYQGPSPQYFPGETLAGFTPFQSQAQGLTAQRATAGSPLLNNAQGTAAQYAGGDFASSPAWQALGQSIRGQIQPSIDSRFMQAGRSFSPAHAGALATGETNALAPFAMNAQQNAINQAPGLSSASYNDFNALNAVGQAQQGQNQTAINDAIQKWNFGQNLPYNKLAQLQQFLTGNYGQNQINTGQQVVPGQQSGSGFGGALGGAALGTALSPGIGTVGGAAVGALASK